MLKGLKGGADGNGDGIITIGELLPYVQEKVPEISEKYSNRKQYPTIYSKGMDFPVVMR